MGMTRANHVYQGGRMRVPLKVLHLKKCHVLGCNFQQWFPMVGGVLSTWHQSMFLAGEAIHGKLCCIPWAFATNKLWKKVALSHGRFLTSMQYSSCQNFVCILYGSPLQRCPYFRIFQLFWNLNPRLWVQGDNTVKELKNQLSGQMISLLIAGGFMDEGGHHHLPMGHTHEDIGVVLRLFFGCVIVSYFFYLACYVVFLPVVPCCFCWDGLYGLVTHLLDAVGDSLQTPMDFKRHSGKPHDISIYQLSF